MILIKKNHAREEKNSNVQNHIIEINNCNLEYDNLKNENYSLYKKIDELEENLASMYVKINQNTNTFKQNNDEIYKNTNNNFYTTNLNKNYNPNVELVLIYI